MRAVALTGYGSGLRLMDKPVPEPAKGELLIRVRASSVNPIDLYVSGGKYGTREYEFPAVPGWDFAGTVERAGPGVRRLGPGDDVFGYCTRTTFGAGTWAEYVTIPDDGAIAHLPAGLTFEQAAALPLAAATALLAVDAVDPRLDEAVLIAGAGGAVGGYAVQLAAMRGARVIATARPADDERMRGLGAATTVDYTSEDVVRAVGDAEPEGIPVLIDLVNDREDCGRLAALVCDGGRVASARWAADARALAARGIAATNVGAHHAGPELMERLAALAAAGTLTIGIGDVRSLADLPAIVQELGRGGGGKVVVLMDD